MLGTPNGDAVTPSSVTLLLRTSWLPAPPRSEPPVPFRLPVTVTTEPLSSRREPAVSASWPPNASAPLVDTSPGELIVTRGNAPAPDIWPLPTIVSALVPLMVPALLQFCAQVQLVVGCSASAPVPATVRPPRISRLPVGACSEPFTIRSASRITLLVPKDTCAPPWIVSANSDSSGAFITCGELPCMITTPNVGTNCAFAENAPPQRIVCGGVTTEPTVCSDSAPSTVSRPTLLSTIVLPWKVAELSACRFWMNIRPAVCVSAPATASTVTV